MTHHEIHVVTRAPEDAGNFACPVPIYIEVEPPGMSPMGTSFSPGKYEHLHPSQAFALRKPVFNVGEILILNESGREYAYPGRKPSKWDVDTQQCATLEEAIELSVKVNSATT